MGKSNHFISYLFRFFGFFCLLFYGTELIIGLSSPEGRFSPFVASYLDFIDPFRRFLLLSAGECVSAFGYKTHFRDAYTISIAGGGGVRMVYSCIGYGVLSFWIAFIFANNGTWQKKAAWMIGGSLALCVINIIRVSLLLVATNKNWPIPLGWDHHTWFNIVAYGLIFFMIWLYDRSGRNSALEKRIILQKKESPQALKSENLV